MQYSPVEGAAYSLMAEPRRRAVHLRIGRCLLDRMTDPATDEGLFDLVHHLSEGVELAETAAERTRIAHFHLMAARKAKTTTAFNSALEYAAAGIALLPADAWETEYDLTLAFHDTAAESACLSRQFDRMETFIEPVVRHARTPLDMITVDEVRIEALKVTNRPAEAIALGLDRLKRLGVKLPNTPSTLHIVIALLKTKLALAGKGPDEIRTPLERHHGLFPAPETDPLRTRRREPRYHLQKR